MMSSEKQGSRERWEMWYVYRFDGLSKVCIYAHIKWKTTFRRKKKEKRKKIRKIPSLSPVVHLHEASIQTNLGAPSSFRVASFQSPLVDTAGFALPRVTSSHSFPASLSTACLVCWSNAAEPPSSCIPSILLKKKQHVKYLKSLPRIFFTSFSSLSPCSPLRSKKEMNVSTFPSFAPTLVSRYISSYTTVLRDGGRREETHNVLYRIYFSGVRE